MSLSSFIQNVKSEGLSKSNRYLVVFNCPNSIKMMNANNIGTYCLFCEQTELPGISYATKGVRTFGEVRETPYDKVSKEILLSFYVDANLELKQFFDAWGNSIMKVNSRTWNYYVDYITPQIDISVLDTSNNTVYIVSLFECYPKSISPVSIGYANNDVMKLNVSMQYKYWTSQLIGNVEEGVAAIGDYVQNLKIDNNGLVIPKNYFTDNTSFQLNTFNKVPPGGLDFFGNAKQEIKQDLPFIIF